MNHPHLTRRDFLRFGTCSAIGTASLFNTLLNLRQVNAAAAVDGLAEDYKALVCVFLYGGNDSANMLVPTDPGQHAIYAAARQNLTLSLDSLHQLNASDASGRAYGLHPAMGELATHINQGKGALLANVGTLLAPVTLDDFRNGSAALPPQLFSHNDQQVLWQTSVPHSPAHYHSSGWGGRMADLLHAVHNESGISMNLSMAGNNFFQTGKTVLPVPVSSGGRSDFRLRTSWRRDDRTKFDAVKAQFDAAHDNILERTYADVNNSAIETSDLFNQAMDGATEFENFPTSGLGQQLRSVAQTIEKRAELGMKRQIFFVATGGYDTHGDQLDAHAGLLGDLSASLSAFQATLGDLGVINEVTTFTASDFGRTFISNGRGSDHGWGGHQLILGGAVQADQIYGSYPEIDLNNSPHDTGRGRWLPTTSVDQYGATLARWFGVSDSNLDLVFPNLPNFSARTLGFLG